MEEKMSKLTQNYEQLAMALGFRFDAGRKIICGKREDYGIILFAEKSGYPYEMTACVSAHSPMGTLERDEIKQFVRDNKAARAINYDKNQVKLYFKNNKNQDKLREGVNSALTNLIQLLKRKGYAPCCQFCGQKQIETSAFDVSGEYMELCPDCAGKLRQDMTMATKQKQNKSENLIGGIVGALLGSVIGAVCIIFFSQLGRIAVISGFVMAICTLKGYELLGGKLTRKGFVIGSILMVAMTYVGDRLDWAIMVMREFETDLFTAYQSIPALIEADIIEIGNYGYNLAMLYLFTIAGAVSVIYSFVKDRKKEGKFGQIGSSESF